MTKDLEMADIEDFETEYVFENIVSTEVELPDVDLDDKALNEDAKKGTLPSGWYRKPDDEWVPKKRIDASDRKKGDAHTEGRLYFGFHGMVSYRDTEGFVYFQISPDKRYRVDRQTGEVDETQWDSSYKLFLEARKFYTTRNTATPKKLSVLVAFLCKESYWVGVSEGKQGGNFVNRFK